MCIRDSSRASYSISSARRPRSSWRPSGSADERSREMSWSDLGTIAPVVVAVLVAAAILIVDMILPGRRNAIVVTALGGLGVVAVVLLAQAGHSGEAFGGAYSLDNMTVFLDFLFVAIAVLTLLFAVDYLEPRGLPIAEFAAVLLFAITGAMLAVSYTHLTLPTIYSV